ncbi:MAG: hypothetical protein QOE41_2185 [Mycobacterium sp.]|jgi:hypothetical protein|nr:luciferase [Mycobacterium sp.]MDT5132874.1 hypothetical protein [Mycobacterium sp.]
MSARARPPAVKLSISVTKFSYPSGPKVIGPELASLAHTLDATAVHTLWVSDHLWRADPSSGPEQPMLEAYTALGFPAANTGTAAAGHHGDRVDDSRAGAADQGGHHTAARRRAARPRRRPRRADRPMPEPSSRADIVRRRAGTGDSVPAFSPSHTGLVIGSGCGKAAVPVKERNTFSHAFVDSHRNGTAGAATIC